MAIPSAIAEWFNVRPQEQRPLALSFLGAFLLLSFVILTRSLREAFFLTTFDIERLPLMVAAVVVAGLPAIGQFSRLLGIVDPRRVVLALTAGLGFGVLLLLAVLPDSPWAVVVFFLWTAVGALLLTSGFWVLVSEQFPLRGAKRLFGLIGAGGTAGAMLAGVSLNWITGQVELVWLVAASAGLLLALFAALALLPRVAQRPPVEEPAAQDGPRLPLLQSLRMIRGNRQLRLIAVVVFCSTLITTLVDYQFKDLARAQYADGADLVAFFGGLYGWAGLAALLLQLFVAGRLLERVSIGLVLGASPLLMLLGGAGLLLVPALLLATAVRGADYALRKAIYRPTIEVLYVPVPQWLRRRTKTVIDSLVDAGAEGAGALVILLVVATAGQPSRYLMVLVIAAAAVLIFLGRRLDREYFLTVARRLSEEDERARAAGGDELPRARDLLSATFTNLDLSSLREGLAIEAPAPPLTADEATASDALLAELESPDDATVMRALDRMDQLDPAHRDALERLIARDSVFQRVIRLLAQFPEESVPESIAALRDPDTEFVVRRRIPDLLARVGGPKADEALLEALTNNRFEVRFRAALALVARRKRDLPEAEGDWRLQVWHAVSLEVRRDRPLWELQKLLDANPLEVDELVTERVGVRGELSLEHTFRLLTLVLEPERVRAAYHGIVYDDQALKSLALEYLEQVLPHSVRHRLWVFIGDLSEKRKRREMRPLDAVVADMMATDLTFFRGDVSRQALQRIIDERQDERETGDR